MGQKIITNNKDRWAIFSSISDTVIAEFETEKDLKNHIAMGIVYDGKLNAIKQLMTYPNGWTINNVRTPLDVNTMVIDEYTEWVKKIGLESETYEEYYNKIDEKLETLL